MKAGIEITISTPQTPSEISSAVFSGCQTAHAVVFQQELIIACADLIVQEPHALDGILTVRLEWLTSALQLLLNYVKEANVRPTDLASFLNCSCPLSVVKALGEWEGSDYLFSPSLTLFLSMLLFNDYGLQAK